MLTGQRDQLTAQLYGATLRIDELDGKLRNSELQAQHLAHRYQADTTTLRTELLTGHSTLSASEFSGQHAAHEFSVKLAATEQAAQQHIQKHQQEAVFFRQQAEMEIQSMAARAALQEQTARDSMQEATSSRTKLSQYHAEMSTLRVQLAAAQASATMANNMATATAEGGTTATTQIIRQLRGVVEQLTIDNATANDTLQELNSKMLLHQSQATATQAQLKNELAALQATVTEYNTALQEARTKVTTLQMERATSDAALNLRIQALSREREAAMTHASCMESDLRGLEFAMQQQGAQSPTNVADITAAIQQQLQDEMESRILGTMMEEREQYEQQIAALTRKLAQAKAYANDVNDQLLKLQAVPDDEMEEEEQEEATGNPTPGGGASEHGLPAGGFSASSAQATFFEELVKKLLKGKSKRDGDDSDSDDDRPCKKEAATVKVPTWPKMADWTVWISQLTRNVNTASARADDKAIAWLNVVRHRTTTIEQMADCEKCFQLLDRKLGLSLTEILPPPMLKKMTLKESIAHNKGTQLRGRQILWLICKEFEVNSSLGFTYGIDDLTTLAFPGDRNLQQFLNRWDEIIGFLDMSLIPETTISQMFLKKIVGSKTLASEVSHWRRLKDTDPDRTYDWLRQSVEKVIQIEREDKNQEDLQRAHRQPIGGQPNAAAKTNAAAIQGNTEKNRGKGKGKGGGKSPKSTGYSSGSNTGYTTPNGNTVPKDQVPCKFLFLYNNCKKGDECDFAHRAPTTAEITMYKLVKSGNNTPNSGLKFCSLWAAGDCKYGENCIFSHDFPQGGGIPNKGKGKGKGKKGKAKTKPKAS